MATSTESRIEELVENFDLLGDWEARFAYLIDLGKALPPMTEEDKCEENRVNGCQAQVWMKFELDEVVLLLAKRLYGVNDNSPLLGRHFLGENPNCSKMSD